MKYSEQDFSLPPFPAFPSVKRYVELGPVMDATHRVARSVIAREAISLIIGPSGTGKSLASALLARQFAGSHDIVAIGDTTITDETSFYRCVLHRLGVAFESRGRDELEWLVQQRLCGDQANPNGAVVIVDEAASLSADVLEAIRRLTNLMRDGQPAVSVVLAGGVKLDDTLTAPPLEAFVQRVAARCYLHPLTWDETRRYVRESIEACEAAADETITDPAVSAIFHATGGVPRLINQLMTEAIDCAAEMDQSVIDERTIDRAWANLQQLPSPIVEEPSIKRETAVVEFGELVEPLAVDPMKVPIQENSIAKLKSELAADSISRADYETETIVAGEPVATAASVEPVNPVKLFGEDFEEEENIQVIADGVAAVRQGACDTELESMIHSEIVGLSHFAADHTDVRNTLESTPAFESVAEDCGAAEPVEHAEHPEPAESFPSVVWYDESNASTGNDAAEESAMQRDDTDLLWITEDIDVDRRAADIPSAGIHRIDGPAETDPPKLNIDYRELLEKMRKQ
jgi:type II secretory pathway predicted ATPase ExeA